MTVDCDDEEERIIYHLKTSDLIQWKPLYLSGAVNPVVPAAAGYFPFSPEMPGAFDKPKSVIYIQKTTPHVVRDMVTGIWRINLAVKLTFIFHN